MGSLRTASRTESAVSHEAIPARSDATSARWRSQLVSTSSRQRVCLIYAESLRFGEGADRAEDEEKWIRIQRLAHASDTLVISMRL